MIFTSDQTQLSTHVGGHSFWPLYMSIGNINSAVRSRPSNNAWILLAQLPVPPKMRKHIHNEDIKRGNAKISYDGFSKTDYERFYKLYKDDALGAVIQAIFDPLKNRPMGIELQCADHALRQGFPVVAAWLADFQEYNKLYTTTQHGCCLCEISQSELGDNVIGSKRNSAQHIRCLQLLHAYKKRMKDYVTVKSDPKNLPLLETFCSEDPTFPKTIKDVTSAMETLEKKIEMADLYFICRQAKPADNALWKTGLAHVQDVWKPDLLHTIYEGVVPHLLASLEQFLDAHGRLHAFEEAWMRIPAFGSVPAPKRSIFETEQRGGKLLREALRNLLPVLVIALDKPKASEHFEFYDCLAACRYIVDFSLICQYRYHTATSLGYLKQYLEGFHRHKSVFNAYRPEPRGTENEAVVAVDGMVYADLNNEDNPFYQSVLAEEDEEVTQRVEEEAAKKKRQAYSTLEKMARTLFQHSKEDLQRWLDLSVETASIDNFEEVIPLLEAIATKREHRFLDHGAYWKIPKLHLLSHFEETIIRFGYLQQYSTEIGETLHKGIKEAYRHGSKNDKTRQILQFHTRKYAVRMRELNLTQLTKDGKYERVIQEALDLFADKSDRLLNARLNRAGIGSIYQTETYQKWLAEERRDQTERFERLLLAEPEEASEPTEEDWYLPSPFPLFDRQDQSLTGWRFSGVVKQRGNTIAEVATQYGYPHFSDAVLHFLQQEHNFPKDIKPHHLDDLRIKTYSTLHLTVETPQSTNPFEIQKCVTSGRFAAPYLEKPRNDSILFLDTDEYSQLTEKQDLSSDVDSYRVGMLKLFCTIKLPKLQKLDEFLVAGVGYSPAECFKDYHFALIDGLQPIRMDEHGEMSPGALIAKFCVPRPLRGLDYNRKQHLAATYTTQRKNGGRLIEISSIVSSAHIISQHSSKESTTDVNRVWAFNNRATLGIWDMLYSKTAEEQENRFTRSEEEDRSLFVGLVGQNYLEGDYVAEVEMGEVGKNDTG